MWIYSHWDYKMDIRNRRNRRFGRKTERPC